MSNITEEINTESKKGTKIGEKVISKLEPSIFKILKVFKIPNDVVFQQLTLLGFFGTKTGKISLYNDIHENDIEYMNEIIALYEEQKANKPKSKAKAKPKKDVETSTEPEKVEEVATTIPEPEKVEEVAASIPEPVKDEVSTTDVSSKKTKKKAKKSSDGVSIEA
jgi:hypothetical protein